MTGNAALLLRVGFSFSLVLGLMWIAARVLRKRTVGRPTDTVEVLARTQLARGSSVTVLRVGDRALVLGVTERTITQLGEPISDLSTLRTTDVLRSALAPDDIPGYDTTDVIRSEAIPGNLLPTPRARRDSQHAVPSAPTAMAGEGALAGSILSPATWRLGMDALRERTVRKG